MPSKSKKSARKSSISANFRRSLITAFVILALILVPGIYYLTRTQVLAQANNELTLLVDMIKSVRNVVREDTRPYFSSKGDFFPVAVSSTVMAKTVAEKFARLRPEYYIKIFGDNPLNPVNQPENLELTFLEKFRSDGELKSIVEVGTINGQDYLVSSAPSKSKKGCLLCHGDPEYAPLAISSKYGKTTGYNWEIDSVVGGIAVGVPLGNIREITITRSVYALGALSVIFIILYLYISAIVRKNIIAPVLGIAETAKQVAKGNLNEKIEYHTNDELGELAHSFEMMRRSYIALIRRFKSK